MRDLDTIRIALTAAETGHLVLASLHTPDAPQTIDRLVDVFPAEQQPQIVAQLSGALGGVLCQRLIPRADGQGRILASEVLVPNHAIRNCIRERKLEQIVGLMEIGHRDGNRTIDQSIVDLLGAQLITREEAIFHCRERKSFEAPPKEARKPKSIWT
jgi:twitching motility protein PilT